MERWPWLLALVATFLAGWAAAGLAGKAVSMAPEVTHLRETVGRLQQQVGTLQARLHAREMEDAAAASQAPRPQPGSQRRGMGGFIGVTATEIPAASHGASRRASAAETLQTDAVPGRAVPPTVEAALDRFYRYLEATSGANGLGGRERWRRARELVEELRGMGDAAAQALMQVLTSGGSADERRAAARLLGTLQVPQSLPLLKDVLEREDDLLLRRAAAIGLRQLQTPEAIPVMQRILANPGEDRLVRLSAAYGLTQSGRPQGVDGLAYIFQESAADGRGREIAFRALASLDDARPLPFMRQVVASDVEPGYRLRAIQYVTAQGDRQALPALQTVMQSPTEQASIRDAAAQAYRLLGGQ